MRTGKLGKFLSEITRNEAGASHLAVGAMLVIGILYASTIM